MAQKAPIYCFYCWTLNRNILNFDLMLDGLWKTKGLRKTKDGHPNFRVRVIGDRYMFWDENNTVATEEGSITTWNDNYPNEHFERWLTTYYELTEVSHVERLIKEYES